MNDRESHVAERDKTRETNAELRDKIIALIRKRGEGMAFTELSKALGIYANRIGRIVGMYPSYLTSDTHETFVKGNRQPGYVDLHKHLKERV